MGRITKFYAGVDSEIRVMDVFTKNGVFRRSVIQICMFPKPETQ